MPSNIVDASFLYVGHHLQSTNWQLCGLDCTILSDTTSAVLMNLHQPAIEYTWHCLLLAVVNLTCKPEIAFKQHQTDVAGCMQRALIVMHSWLQVDFVDQLIVCQTTRMWNRGKAVKIGQYCSTCTSISITSGHGNTACAIIAINNFCTCTMSH